MTTQNQNENDKQSIAKAEQTASERFMNMVIKEFGSGVSEVALTDFQKRLAQNYFIALDETLKKAEEKRLKSKVKEGNKWVLRNELPIVWSNVNMKQLACDVVSAARIGLDPAQRNHISMVPYKCGEKYEIGFIDGYRGLELKAKKYGLDIPDAVTVELVYKNDKFKVVKKDANHPVESYEFEIVNSFDRGEIVGGFYYYSYAQSPEKNQISVFTMKDIMKRKPKYASAEFWGGEKDVWENGQKVGKETIEGWFDEMCHKTIYRAAYNDITIDSQKIDSDYLNLKQREHSMSEAKIDEEIAENANKDAIDIKGNVVEDEPPTQNGQGQMDLGKTGTEDMPY
jgi:recombination protein RecT